MGRILYLLLIGFILIIIAISLVYSEVREIKKFCDNNNETFHLTFSGYKCGNESVYKYSSGWDFEKALTKPINFSNITFP